MSPPAVPRICTLVFLTPHIGVWKTARDAGAFVEYQNKFQRSHFVAKDPSMNLADVSDTVNFARMQNGAVKAHASLDRLGLWLSPEAFCYVPPPRC